MKRQAARFTVSPAVTHSSLDERAIGVDVAVADGGIDDKLQRRSRVKFGQGAHGYMPNWPAALLQKALPAINFASNVKPVAKVCPVFFIQRDFFFFLSHDCAGGLAVLVLT